MWERDNRDERHFGDWSFELRGDEIADLQWQGRRVLRSIRAVIRDGDWDTAALIVDSVEESDAELTLLVRSDELGSSFSGAVRVTASGDTIAVTADLRSAAAFETNRTGLVVLSPPQTAGAELVVDHADGAAEATRFPAAISPHQPVIDIAALHWSDDGVNVDVRFAGDVFEMEDQRNWTDASFKTYSRPLSLPFPYAVAAGEQMVQSVTVRAAAAGPAPSKNPEGTVIDLVVIDLVPAGAFPKIGLGASSAPDPAPPIPQVGASVLVELDLASSNWRAALNRAASGGQPLDVQFILDPESPDPENPDAATDALLDAVGALAGHDVLRVAAFHQVGDARHVSDHESVDRLRHALSAAGLEIPVIGGSRSHFTELNRERHRLPDDLAGLTVTCTPLFHARDTEQLVESVAIQRLVAQQSVTYADGIPVHVGPVCLSPRFNDVATSPQPSPTRSDLAEGYGAEFTGSADPRQSANELAAWTIASAAALAVPGVASISWFEQWGPRGIRTADGTPLPVEAAIAALADVGDAELLWNPHPDGLRWAMAARSENATIVLAANIGSVECTMSIRTPAGSITATVPAGSFRRILV